jgi:glycosyltransferase involved in cell wall biosynthesis
VARTRRYCLVSPCRDEAGFLGRTLASVVAQSELPTRWIIVDDGSTDDTPRLLHEAAAKHTWIEVVRREDRGVRKVGPGVIEAFYEGFARLEGDPWDYVCKLDMDLVLPRTYFASLMDLMEADPRLGTASGQTYYIDSASGQEVSERISPEMSIGASKFYRRRCFEQIGGLVRGVMWDGIDCHRARLLGWKAGAFEDPALRFLHLRPMGSSQKGILAGRRRHGYGQWFMGTGLGYMTVSALYRMAQPPRVLGGLAMWWGYVASALRREPRLQDRPFRRFLRRYQRAMLLRGKRRATAAIETRQASNWSPDAKGPWDLDPAPDRAGEPTSP